MFTVGLYGITAVLVGISLVIPVIIIIALVLGGIISPETRNKLYEKTSVMGEGKR